MQDKDKIILVFYIGVGNLSPAEVSAHMSQSKSKMSLDESVLSFFVAIRGTDTRIECISPRFIDNHDEYIKMKNLVESYEKEYFSLEKEKIIY